MTRRRIGISSFGISSLGISSLALACAVACKSKRDAPIVSDPAPDLIVDAEAPLAEVRAFCRAAYLAPFDEFTAGCTPRDRTTPVYARLAEHAQDRLELCEAMLGTTSATFHADAADACRAAVRELFVRGRMRVAWSDHLAACDALLEGKVHDGERCAFDAECGSGSGCSGNSPDNDLLYDKERFRRGTCEPRIAAGGRCDTGPTFRPSYLFITLGIGRLLENCLPGLACVKGACVAVDGGLGAPPRANAPCRVHDHCAEGEYCNAGACAARKPAGGACARDEECKGLCASSRCASLCGSG